MPQEESQHTPNENPKGAERNPEGPEGTPPESPPNTTALETAPKEPLQREPKPPKLPEEPNPPKTPPPVVPTQTRDASLLLFPATSSGLWIYALADPTHWPTLILSSLTVSLLGLTLLLLLRFQAKPIQTLNLLLSITSLACVPFAAGGLFVTQQIQKKAQAQEKSPPPNPPKAPKENISPEEKAQALQLQVATDEGAEEKATYEKEVRSLLEKKGFKELEQMATELRKNPTRFPKTGIWKIRAFYNGLSLRPKTTRQTLEADLALLNEWKKSEPRSATALNAETELLLEYAWQNRGPGPQSSIKKENLDAFREKLNEAQDSLLKSKELAPRDQQWYYQALQIGIAGQCEETTLINLFQEGMKKYPEDYLLAQIRSAGLSEKWGGRKGEWENYATRLSHGSPLGNEIYTWIVLTHEKDYTKIFHESQADWTKTKDGLESLLHKYPQWAWLQNQAAYLAVLGEDRAFALEQFTKLGDEYLPEVWGQPERFAHFRNWAKTGEW